MPRYLGPTPHIQAAAITPRMAAAYHESGHAIVALCNGLTIDEINVNERGGGQCFYQRRSIGSTKAERIAWASTEMQVLYGGREAQRWIDPHRMARTCHDDRADLEHLMSAVTILIGDEDYARELAAAARLEAARLIDRMWPLVKKLSKALSARGKLTGEEIWKILGGKPGAPQTKSVKSSPPILMARVDGGINLPPDVPPPDPGQCEAVTRAFQRRHSGRDYTFD